MGYAPDSRSPGYLGPTTETLVGVPWEDFLQAVIAGVTAIPGNLVRPRWQPQPPTTPDVATNWCAFGVIAVDADYEPWINHYDLDTDHDLLARTERVTILASFYGPDSEDIAAVLRDGLYVDQNRAVLRANGVGIIEVEDIIRTADLFRQQFRQRDDLRIILRRQVKRLYNVLDLLRAKGPITANSAGGERTITTGYDTETIAEEQPPGETTWDDGQTLWDDDMTMWDRGV
jgi:hypothetical protein